MGYQGSGGPCRLNFATLANNNSLHKTCTALTLLHFYYFSPFLFSQTLREPKEELLVSVHGGAGLLTFAKTFIMKKK